MIMMVAEEAYSTWDLAWCKSSDKRLGSRNIPKSYPFSHFSSNLLHVLLISYTNIIILLKIKIRLPFNLIIIPYSICICIDLNNLKTPFKFWVLHSWCFLCNSSSSRPSRTSASDFSTYSFLFVRSLILELRWYTFD